MATQKLGLLEKVDVRTIWGDETREFTPWLAENLHLLGDVLKLNLTKRETEGEVGSLFVDIVADSDQGLVVIENQLEKSNHSHLGQLLSYGAGRGARFLVWVAPEFKEEHRATLDWLNENLAEDVEFYAVEVRVARIGDSMPAPEFRAVASPNSWSRQVGTKNRDGSADYWTRDNYREFFRPVIDSLHEQELADETGPSGAYFQAFPSEVDIDGVEYRISLTTPREGHSANVVVYMGAADSDFNLRVFDSLVAQKDEIEHKLGEELVWRRAQGYRPAISLTRPISLLKPPEQHKDVQNWMIGALPRLKEVFDPLLLSVADELETEESERVDDNVVGDDVD